MSTQQQQQHSRPLSSDSTKPKQQETPNAVNPTQDTTVAVSHEGTQSPTPVKPVTLPARKASIQIQNMRTRAERRSLVPHSVDHYRVQLIEKETQLHVAQKETERLTWLLKSMEEEMRKIRRENTELVKLHGMMIELHTSYYRNLTTYICYCAKKINFREECSCHQSGINLSPNQRRTNRRGKYLIQ